MKISLRKKDGFSILCLETDDGIFDINRVLEGLNDEIDPGYIANLENFLNNPSSIGLLILAKEAIDKRLRYQELAVLESALVFPDLTHLPVIQKPPLMFGLAGNCPTTWRNKDIQAPIYPVGYARPWRSLSPHNGRVRIPQEVTSFRCAAELGVVIGKEAFQVHRNDAMEYVFGYICVNDMISNHWKSFARARSINNASTFIELMITSYYGRGTDGFGPVGPAVVTKDEIENPYDLIMFTRFNNEVEDRSHTGAMIVGIETAIEYLSQSMTLKPGSIIHMGTMGIDGIDIPEGRYLSEKDYVEIEIEHVGLLRSYFDDRRK